MSLSVISDLKKGLWKKGCNNNCIPPHLSPLRLKEISAAVPHHCVDCFLGLSCAICIGLWPGTCLHPGLHSNKAGRCLQGVHHVRNDRAWSCTHLQRSFTFESRALLSGETSLMCLICVSASEMDIQYSCVTSGPSGFHLYTLHAHPSPLTKEWSSKEEHGPYETRLWRKAGYSVPSEWKATF